MEPGKTNTALLLVDYNHVTLMLASDWPDCVLVTEDSSKKTREAQQQLRRFAVACRKDNPDLKTSLQYDRLYINGDIFMFNENKGCVELIRLMFFGLPQY